MNIFRIHFTNERTISYVLFVLLGIPIILFAIIPFIELFCWSFTNKVIGEAGSYVGLTNYLQIYQSRLFLTVLKQTCIYTFVSVFIKLLFGLILAIIVAYVINHNKRFYKYIIPLLILPWAIPTVTSIVIWSWIFYDVNGVLNNVLIHLGIVTKNTAWLGSHSLATLSLITVNVWRGTGYFFVSILAAHLNIPHQQYLIAKIEGTSLLRIFHKITLPNLSGTISIIVLISLINTFTDFQLVHLLTDGGPGDSTQVFSTMIYDLAFKGRSTLGYASSFALSQIPILIIILFLLIPIVNRVSK